MDAAPVVLVAVAAQAARRLRIKARLLAACTAVVVVGSLLTLYFVTEKYGGELVWPNVVGGFLATLLAFGLALLWDRANQEAENARREEVEDKLRITEAQRRFSLLDIELTALNGSIESVLKEHRKARFFLPDLSTGSWLSARERLGQIVADVKLMADLATFYGRVEDLQWRLRCKAEAHIRDHAGERQFDVMIDAIADEALRDLEDLRYRVGLQKTDPDVQAVGLHQKVYLRAASEGTSSTTADLTVKKGNGADK